MCGRRRWGREGEGEEEGKETEKRKVERYLKIVACHFWILISSI